MRCSDEFRWWLDDCLSFTAEVMLPALAVVLIVTVFVAALAVGGIFGSAYWIDQPACHATGAGLRMPHRWSFWAGCQVFTEREGWIPLRNLIVHASAR